MPSARPMSYTGQPDSRLLQGCIREAERCDLTSYSLDGLRNALPETYHAHMVTLTDEIRASSRLLRDLVGRTETHSARTPILLEYLNVIVPCLSRSLQDIDGFIEDRSVSKDIRWRKMYYKMTDEVGGIPLPQRFMLYNTFLKLLYQLLTRDPDFDLNTLEELRNRIMELREKRGIALPTTLVGPLTRPSMIIGPMSQEPPAHWAEQIFSLPLTSRTALKGSKRSKSYGPHRQLSHTPLPPDSTVLFRRSFDNNALSLVAYINGAVKAPYLKVRSVHQGLPWISIRGVHELRIRRNHGAVELRRWSHSEQTSKLWAALYFITWEEMVLFYCSFGSLKAQNTMTVEVDLEEYMLQGERRLFQAQIIDDGFKHSLIVFEDNETKGIRLHAAVWEGPLRQCPVWTAFVTHQSASPTWLVQKSRHRVWLKDVQPYVFCQRYRLQNQRKGREGAFELNFINERAAARFKDVFYPPNSPILHTDSEKEGGPSR